MLNSNLKKFVSVALRLVRQQIYFIRLLFKSYHFYYPLFFNFFYAYQHLKNYIYVLIIISYITIKIDNRSCVFRRDKVRTVTIRVQPQRLITSGFTAKQCIFNLADHTTKQMKHNSFIQFQIIVFLLLFALWPNSPKMTGTVVGVSRSQAQLGGVCRGLAPYT